MNRIRIGNDIDVRWAIYVTEGTQEVPYDLTGRNVSLYLKGPMGRVAITDFTTNGNVIRWVYGGRAQKYTGRYSLELIENEGESGMHTVDECDAFRLVARSCEARYDQEGHVECIHLHFQTTLCGGDSLNATYQSAISDKSIVMPAAVGGLAAGTTVESLEGLTYNELFDSLLFPTASPVITEPSATLAFNSYAAVQEVGAAGPVESDFIVGYNPGSIYLNGVEQSGRGGEHNTPDSFIYVNGDSEDKILPEQVPAGTTLFIYRAAYFEGPQPKDSKGNDYGSPLPAGTVDSSPISLLGIYPWFATTSGATATDLVKQPLKKTNTYSDEFTLQSAAICEQIIETPEEITEIKVKEPMSGNFIESTLDKYIMSEVTRSINGVTKTYYRYEYDVETNGYRSEVTLKIKF